MQHILVQLLLVCAFALVAWWLAEKFSPDELLTKIVKLLIFICVLLWAVTRLLPAVF